MSSTRYRKLTSVGLAAAIAWVAMVHSASSQSVGHPLDGEWTDERDTKLALEVDGDQVSGTYSPVLVSADCLGGENKVIGVVSGDIVGLSIALEKCDGVVTLVGQIADTSGDEVLFMSWVKNNDIEDQFEEQALWASFSFGTSSFRR